MLYPPCQEVMHPLRRKLWPPICPQGVRDCCTTKQATKSFDCVSTEEKKWLLSALTAQEHLTVAASEALMTNGVPRVLTSWCTKLLKGRKVAANLQGVTQSHQGEVAHMVEFSHTWCGAW